MLVPMEHRVVPLTSEGVWDLFAELNHRVGNELQVALSALRLAKCKVASAEAMQFIDQAAVRLECFGEVHRLLDRHHRQGPLARRMEALCRSISLSKAASQGIHLRLTVEDVGADEETAWTVCAVAFELITNAFKHAFVEGLPGVVDVALRNDGEGVLLMVRDNGVGAVERGRPETVCRAPGFGSGIVTQLAERLGGFVTRVGGPVGTIATLRVPLARRLQS
jgi:two-component system, sensor histidine kinase PdtaS